MAISGSIQIEGLEITGSYTNIDNFIYKKNNNNEYSIMYSYSIYVNEEHRNKNTKPIFKDQQMVVFTDTTPIDPFFWMYGHIKSNPYFVSGSSLVDC
jgi:hypothetical protein